MTVKVRLQWDPVLGGRIGRETATGAQETVATVERRPGEFAGRLLRGPPAPGSSTQTV